MRNEINAMAINTEIQQHDRSLRGTLLSFESISDPTAGEYFLFPGIFILF